MYNRRMMQQNRMEQPMTPQVILRKTRLAHELTLEDMANLLDTSKQRLSQYESGDNIKDEKLTEWAKNDKLPQWVRDMAWQAYIASVRDQIAALSTRLNEIEQHIGITIAA